MGYYLEDMMLQLNPPIPLDTTKGKGLAHILLDYGTEYDLIWVVFIDETGECWCFRNPEIVLQKNYTFGRYTTNQPPKQVHQ